MYSPYKQRNLNNITNTPFLNIDTNVDTYTCHTNTEFQILRKKINHFHIIRSSS